MFRKVSISTARRCAFLGMALTGAASAALLGGCKGNTTSAAMMEHRMEKPPVVLAHPAGADMKAADPLSSPAWQNAMMTLTPPANTTRTTAPTRGAVLFDATTLYAAFICEKPVNAAAQSRDVVSLYLDTLAEGKELFQVTVDSSGKAQCAWMRSSAAAEPLEDGSPDLGHPVFATPDLAVKGLWTQVREGVDRGNAVWTVQIALPLAGLPARLQVKPLAGTHWKFNLVRTFTTMNGGQVVDQAQANLSPFYVNAQAVSPYRMAELDFPEPAKLAANQHE